MAANLEYKKSPIENKKVMLDSNLGKFYNVTTSKVKQNFIVFL